MVRWRLRAVLAVRPPSLIGIDGASATGEPRERHPQLAEIGRVGIDYRLDGDEGCDGRVSGGANAIGRSSWVLMLQVGFDPPYLRERAGKGMQGGTANYSASSCFPRAPS